MTLTYQAQYEIIDQEQPLSALAVEARQRMIEDILQLGMVLEGESSEPALIDIDGRPWIQLQGRVRNAGQLLERAAAQS